MRSASGGSLRHLILLGALAVPAGLIFKEWMMPRADPAKKVSSASPAEIINTCDVQSQADLRRVIREEVGRIVREELARYRTRAAFTNPKSSADLPASRQEKKEPAPATQEALSTIETAIARGRWTADDASQWSGFVGQLSVPARVEIERRLFVAINRGQVIVEPGVYPLGPLRARYYHQ